MRAVLIFILLSFCLWSEIPKELETFFLQKQPKNKETSKFYKDLVEQSQITISGMTPHKRQIVSSIHRLMQGRIKKAVQAKMLQNVHVFYHVNRIDRALYGSNSAKKHHFFQVLAKEGGTFTLIYPESKEKWLSQKNQENFKTFVKNMAGSIQIFPKSRRISDGKVGYTYLFEDKENHAYMLTIREKDKGYFLVFNRLSPGAKEKLSHKKILQSFMRS